MQYFCAFSSQKVGDVELIEARQRIIIPGSAAHDDTRNEVGKDKLMEELNREGYNLKRSFVWLDLLPRKSQTVECKKHVHLSSVKLYKSQNSKDSSPYFHKVGKNQHDSHSGNCWNFGPEEVTFHSQGDNAKVPIGITAIKETNPFIHTYGVPSYFAWSWLCCWLQTQVNLIRCKWIWQSLKVKISLMILSAIPGQRSSR